MHTAFLTTSISRLSGGLFPLLRGMGVALHTQGVRVSVLGVADAHSAEDRVHWAPLDLQVFPPRGPAGWGYGIGYAQALRTRAPDLLHHHGLWQYHDWAGWRHARRTRVPTVISPQGMLDPWALANSRWKKRLAAAVFQNAQLHGAAILHAVAAPEAEAIRAYGLRIPICIIPNGVDLPPPRLDQSPDRSPDQPPDPSPPWPESWTAGRRVVLFLGRLHPKKGLRELLDGWQRWRREAPADAAGWALAIAGWDQAGTRARLEAQVAELGLHDQVCFTGPLHDAPKAAAFQRAAAFILPSFSEGMPSAVLEAWSHGLPVLMTPACNLPEGFTAGAALSIAPTAAGVATGLHALHALGDDARDAMGRRGRALAEDTFSWSALATRLRTVYAWLLGGGDPPRDVMR